MLQLRCELTRFDVDRARRAGLIRNHSRDGHLLSLGGRSRVERLVSRELPYPCEAVTSPDADRPPPRTLKSPNPKVTDNKQCYSCGGMGHLAAECPSVRVGYVSHPIDTFALDPARAKRSVDSKSLRPTVPSRPTAPSATTASNSATSLDRARTLPPPSRPRRVPTVRRSSPPRSTEEELLPLPPCPPSLARLSCPASEATLPEVASREVAEDTLALAKSDATLVEE